MKSNASEAEVLFTKAEKCEEKASLKEARGFLLRAADLDHTGAQITLGNNFASGKGVRRSDEKAAYWYKRAYRNGDESGALNLAIDKLKVKNVRAAIFWLRRAVEMGSGEAALELAKIYLGRKGGRPKAIHLLQLTQKMKKREISDDAKRDASTLLSTIIDASQ